MMLFASLLGSNFDKKFTRRISPYAFLLTPIFDFPSRKNCIPALPNLQTFSFRGTVIATRFDSSCHFCLQWRCFL